MDAPPAAPKELHAGRYVLLAPLGQGAQGTTWDAVDKREGRAVAVKAFDVRGAKAWKDVELAEREARVLSELEHPALPRYIEHFEEEGVLYLVMEKIEGTPLSRLQKRGPCMDEREVFRLLHEADRVLAYLHDRTPPVIHRDLKPSNVIRRTDGSFAFVDFGAVKDHLRPEGGSTVVGTFGYMAPEQFQGRAGPASDVYAIGATAIAMLSGHEPEKLAHRGLSLDVAAAVGGRVSPAMVEVLSRMLEPDPDLRASRIGPLLERSAPRGRRDRDARRRWQDAVEASRTAAREAARSARHDARRAAKEARRDGRPAGGGRPPFAVRHVIGAALTIAQIAVMLALQVAVPIVLTLLSLVFGDALRRAASSVRVAGGQAGDAIRDARTRMHRGWDSAGDVRVRVPPPKPAAEGARVRVATTEREVAPVEDEAWRDPEQEDEPAARRRRR